jgi:hypothetical protein
MVRPNNFHLVSYRRLRETVLLGENIKIVAIRIITRHASHSLQAATGDRRDIVHLATMFSHVSRIDANQSHFSDVGRDQHNVTVGRDQNIATHDQHIAGRDLHIHQTNLIVVDTFSEETIQQALSSCCHNSQELPPVSFTQIFTSNRNRSACGAACTLIVEITRLLVDLTKFSIDYQYLQALLLKPLNQTLFLTGLAVQAYEDTPLARNLNLSIGPDVQKCHLTLQYMHDSINKYRRILYSTPIRDLWPKVLWSGSTVHILAWRLSTHQRFLGQFLVALNS